DRRRRRLRLPRRPQAPGPRRAPAPRARVGVPARPGAAPAVAALPPLQPALRHRLRTPVPRAPARPVLSTMGRIVALLACAFALLAAAPARAEVVDDDPAIAAVGAGDMRI